MENQELSVADLKIVLKNSPIDKSCDVITHFKDNFNFSPPILKGISVEILVDDNEDSVSVYNKANLNTPLFRLEGNQGLRLDLLQKFLIDTLGIKIS